MSEDTKEAVLIDAGGDLEATSKLVNNYNAKIKYILNTHGHLDHVAGDYDIHKNMGAKVLLHKADEFLIDSFQEHITMFGMAKYNTPKVDEYITDGQEIKLDGLTFKVIHTPGHSPGSVSYLIDNVLFSGDTLFADSVGRTDLPGGSYEELRDSVKNKLFFLDESIVVYPGHGPSTIIKHEKYNNPFFGLNK
jgi:glyoxylase-like metal-dependent hydrolase (beta-lactamase superfamily II)